MRDRAYRLAFPRDLGAERVQQVLLALAGASTVATLPVRSSVRTAGHGRLEHFLIVPPARQGLAGLLSQLVPGLVADADEGYRYPADGYLWRLWQSSSRRPLRSDRAALVSRTLLGALLRARSTEVIELQWVLGPVRRPLSVGSHHAGVTSESWARALAEAAIRPPGELDAEARAALRSKRGEPGWRAVGQIIVSGADRDRARRLAAGVLSAIRTAEGPGVRLGVRRRPVRIASRKPLRWPLEFNVTELAGLLAWPIDGAGDGLPVAVQLARRLAPREITQQRGRTLGLTVHDRPLRLADIDARRHLLLTGPTGTGKSTLITQLVLQDLAHGHGVLLLDPKGDLVREVLGRFPENRRNDLVVIDPTDAAPVGINPLHRPDQPALVADQLLGIFTSLYSDSFGPRTADVLGAAFLTLARWGEGSLAVLPLLLTHPGLRRRVVGTAADPFGTGPFWAWFDRLKDAERQQIIAPSLNKLRAFTVRPDLRAVLGQVAPRFGLAGLVRGRPVILVSLPKGQLGPEAASLLGTMLLNQAWQTVQARSALPETQRRQLHIYVDEIADFLRLPGDVGEVLVQARSLGVGFTLAHQHLDQLPSSLRATVLANARSRVAFQLSSEDARVFATGHPEIEAVDLANLPAYEAYASLLVGNRVQPYASLRTLPLGPITADARQLLQVNRDRFGMGRAAVDAGLQQLLDGPAAAATTPIGSRPRRQP